MSASTDPNLKIQELEAEVHRLNCAISFTVESTLHEVAEWLDSIGQYPLAKRLDPRRDDDYRQHAQDRIISTTH